MRNTVEGFGEMVSWFEAPLMHSSFSSACATHAFQMRSYLVEKMNQYGFDESFMLRYHSYGFRGHRSLEDAYWAGVSWNLFLHGTDDFHTTYHTPYCRTSSISAQAHKVVQQFDEEYDSYKHAIKVTADYGEKVVLLVIDTYDPYRVINEFLYSLALYAKKIGIHIILRPDSGDTVGQILQIHQVVKEKNR